MKLQIKLFIIIISAFIITAEKSKYKNYQNRKIVEILNNNSDVVFESCLVTSVPGGFLKEDMEFYNLSYIENLNLCNITELSSNSYESVVITPSHRCGMIQQKANARSLNIKILLYITKQQVALPYLQSELDIWPAVVLMPAGQLNLKKEQFQNLQIGIYGSTDYNFSSLVSSAIMFSLVMTTVVIMMGFTVGCAKNLDLMNIANQVNINYMVWILPIFMVGALLLMYFFYEAMVWVIIIIFYLLSAHCLTMIAAVFIDKWNYLPQLRKPFNRFSIQYIDYRYIIFFIFGLVISTVWIICRNNTIGLVLNNIMGVYVCVEAAISFGTLFVAGRNFKIVLIIMTTVVVVDAVMVYVPIRDTRPDTSQQISLYSTKDQLSRNKRNSHDSIMESVATAMGDTANEEIPVRFKVPRLEFGNDSSSDPCMEGQLQYTLVGFGDLILPGAFIVHMMIFAVIANSNVTLYFLLLCFSYAFGLVLTNITVHLTLKGQPALVFLLPCTIVPTLLLSLVRGELALLWSGTWLPETFGHDFNEVSQIPDTTVV